MKVAVGLQVSARLADEIVDQGVVELGTNRRGYVQADGAIAEASDAERDLPANSFFVHGHLSSR
jgi:hypothetical protein